MCAGAEILTGNVRVLYSSMGTCLSFAFGYMLLPLCAYFLRDWKSLLLALSLPGLAFLPLWWYAALITRTRAVNLHEQSVTLDIHTGSYFRFHLSI